MILIVEGPDNVGKSTLIKNIRKHILTSPHTIAIHSSSTPNGEDSIKWPFYHYCAILDLADALSFAQHWNVILDRSHLGEYVYGSIYRGISDKDLQYLFEIEDIIKYSGDTYLILLTDEPENLLEREDGDSLSANIEDITNVTGRFLEAYNKSSIENKLHYNLSTDGGFDNLFPTVKEFLKNAKNNGHQRYVN